MDELKFYHPNELPSRKWLLECMTPYYMFTHNYACFVSRYVELPVCFVPGFLLRSQVLDPMTLATVGSVEAAYMAMDQGWAINLSGGYHHANGAGGEGFCVIPDITYVTNYLRQVYLVKKILIIDLDAHQGNGHERDHMQDNMTYIIDAYHHGIYPGDNYAAQRVNHDISIRRSTGDDAFLRDVDESMAKCIQNFQPDFVVYNAGTDILRGDPLGGLNISKEGIIERDEIVFSHCLKTPSDRKAIGS